MKILRVTVISFGLIGRFKAAVGHQAGADEQVGSISDNATYVVSPRSSPRGHRRQAAEPT